MPSASLVDGRSLADWADLAAPHPLDRSIQGQRDHEHAVFLEHASGVFLVFE